MSTPPGRKALALGSLVTITAALVSHISPGDAAATLVALVFGGATYFLVLRRDDASIEAHGLSLGGLLTTAPLSRSRLLRDGAEALGWSLLACAVTFPAFWFGYRIWYAVDQPLSPALDAEFWDGALGHLVVIALPEEMFYRGYLQTALDKAYPPRLRVLGAQIGWGLVVSSAVFAIGHVLSTPHVSRLSVFFPSLLFGWLRARTGGIGSGVLYHAACNVFAAFLARSYGLA